MYVNLRLPREEGRQMPRLSLPRVRAWCSEVESVLRVVDGYRNGEDSSTERQPHDISSNDVRVHMAIGMSERLLLWY